MAKGTVKFFNAAKGYGFIAPEMGGGSPRTTKLYDRRSDKITQDAVERIRIE